MTNLFIFIFIDEFMPSYLRGVRIEFSKKKRNRDEKRRRLFGIGNDGRRRMENAGRLKFIYGQQCLSDSFLNLEQWLEPRIRVTIRRWKRRR